MLSRNLLVCSVAAAAIAATPRLTYAAASCVPGFSYGAFGKSSVDYGGNSGCDAWNSSAGTYSQTVSGGCDLGTDGTSSGAMTIHGTASSVFGNVWYGAGGTSSSLTVNGHPGYGTSGSLTSNLNLPSVTIPTLGSNLGAQTGGTLSPGNTYTSVSGSFTAPAGTYVIGSLSGTINVSSGPVTIYVSSSFSLSSVNNTTGIPGNLIFMVGPSVSSIDLTGVGGYFALYAPDTDVSNHGNADIYGAIVAKTFTMTGTAAIHYDKALQTLAAGSFTCAMLEVSRGTPIMAPLNGGASYLVQGSFVVPTTTPTTISTTTDVATFKFPFVRGHMRARLASTISTAGSTLASGTSYFDAGLTGAIPAANYAGCSTFTGSCRHIFTNVNSAATSGVTFKPTTVTLSDSTASQVGALMAPTSVVSGIGATQWKTIVETVMSGKLGGVDRSIVAVIQASGIAGNANRPTMVYFGGDDGMIHAVCAQTGGSGASSSSLCPSPGTELWAFMPRVELPLVRTNTTRLDGSVKVVDSFGDTSGNGLRGWHTILMFNTGTASATPASYALDITDPGNPSVLWERTAPTSPGSLAMGAGLTVSAGSVLISGTPTNVAFFETANGGTGGTGVVVTAVAQETGAQLWQFGYLYPSPPRGVSADNPLPATGIPGGASAVDLVGQGFVTDVVFGDLYGNLWRVNALSGASRNGSGVPLFSFSSNKHPIGAAPAIYSIGGSQYALFASGGYADPTATSWSSSTTQYLISAKLAGTGATISETTPLCSTCALAVNQTLVGGDRAFSQALVVGNQAFLASDSSDINLSAFGTATINTGHITTLDLTGGSSTTTIVVSAGATSIANAGTNLYNSSGSQQQQLSVSANGSTGKRTDVTGTIAFFRSLWLRTE
jgi:hypothetical protein